jgi:hypothetical protein
MNVQYGLLHGEAVPDKDAFVENLIDTICKRTTMF